MDVKRIVTFGELMLRLNPEGYQRLVQAERLEASYAGGEANAAVSLANFGMDAAFVTKLPDHALGQAAVNALRRYGVDTREIVRGGARIGVYFVEKGASQRPSKVIYDRAGSAISQASVNDFNWERIFSGTDWFHFTGITPALGGELPLICLAACREAKRQGVTVSCDLNYRNKLWSREDACRVMSELMPYVDVCIANEEDAKDVFGIAAAGTALEKGEIREEGYVDVAERLTARFGFQKVAITLRRSISASVNDWAGMLYSEGRAYFSPRYHMQIVDRVGGGDSFAGGLIYGLLSGYGGQEAVNFAAAASCLKHSIEHDFNLVTVDEAAFLAGGNSSGRVQR